MEYVCEICEYKTKSDVKLNSHNMTKRHQANKKIEDRLELKLTKQKIVYDKKLLDKDIECIRKLTLKKLEYEKKLFLQKNNFIQKITNDLKMLINKGFNMKPIVSAYWLSYIQDNFTTAPILVKSRNYSGNNNFALYCTAMNNYRDDELESILCEMLIAKYRKDNEPENQSIWVIDIESKTFATRVFANGVNKWVVDDGKLLTKIIIKPFIEHIKNGVVDEHDAMDKKNRFVNKDKETTLFKLLDSKDFINAIIHGIAQDFCINSYWDV